MIYDIAGLRVSIENKYEYTTKLCRGYLSADQTSPCDLSVSASAEDIEKERKCGSVAYPDSYLENICIYRNLCVQIPKSDRFLLHCVALECAGDGFVFLGRSGAGKSTHSGLWLKYLDGTRIVNGDKPIVHFDGKNFVAYGTPWMGKEGRGCNSSTVIRGACFIEQAKTNRIEWLSVGDMTIRFFSQILLPTDETNAARTLELADIFVRTVPAYVLYCDISEEAVKTSYEAMTGKKYVPQKPQAE